MEIRSLIINGTEYIPKPTGGGCGCLGSIGIALLFLLMMFGGNNHDEEKGQPQSVSSSKNESKTKTTTKDEESNAITWGNDTDIPTTEDFLDNDVPENDDYSISEYDVPVVEPDVEPSTESPVLDNPIEKILNHNQDFL